MTIGEAYKDFWKRYIDFKGNSTRKQYWVPTLIHIAIYILFMISGVVSIIMGGMTSMFGMVLIFIVALFALSIIIPTIAVQVRRLHDINRKGFLVYLSLIVGFVQGFTTSYTQSINGTNYEMSMSDPLSGTIQIISTIISIWLLVYMFFPTAQNHVHESKRKWV